MNTQDSYFTVEMKQVKKGDFLRRKADAKKTYVRGDYNRSLKAFECYDYNDINSYIWIKPNKLVVVGFEF